MNEYGQGSLFFYFKTRRIHLLICFIILHEMMVMFWFVWSIAFDTLCILNSVWKHHISQFPAIFALEHIWVYIYLSNSSNVVFYIKTFVNKTLSLASTLNIPNVQPDNGHIQFWEYFDNMWLWCQNDIIKNLILFDNIFNNLWYYRRWWDFLEVRDIYDLEIGLWLG